MQIALTAPMVVLLGALLLGVLLLSGLLLRRGRWRHLAWVLPAAGLTVLLLDGGGAAHTRPFATAEAEMECRRDAACWGERHLAVAARSCFPKVEANALREHRWREADRSARLPRIAILDTDRGIVAYEGDAVEMRDGFGQWVRHAYSCTLDPSNGAVRVRLRATPV